MQSNKLTPKCLANEYAIICRIGKGAFADVYKARRMTDNFNVAVKVERRNGTVRLIMEHNIYRKLLSRGCRGYVPCIYDFIQTNDYNMLTMELLGSSLDELFVNANKQFSIGTVLFLGIDILKIIEKVHNAGFIHRDIKPNNFLIGMYNKRHIYLTDFGLSKRYITSQNMHIKETFKHSMVGTARYSSINMHLGIEPSRRDDLESIGYMLIYLAKGQLPWQGCGKHGDELFEMIGKIKLSTKIENLCENIPTCFFEYIKYCRSLRFDETPNYQALIKLFRDATVINKCTCAYEWLNSTR